MSSKKQSLSPDRYQYRVNWSTEDDAFLARVAEFPSLSAHGDSQEKALEELRSVVKAVLLDLTRTGEYIPEPISDQEYSGKLNLRMPPYLHRRLVMEAAEEGVSLNYLINLRLADLQYSRMISDSAKPLKPSLDEQGKILINQLVAISKIKNIDMRPTYGKDLPVHIAFFLDSVQAELRDRELIYQHLFVDPLKVIDLLKKYLPRSQK